MSITLELLLLILALSLL